MQPERRRGDSVDALVEAIRAEIMAGTLGPGQLVSQDEWAERMSVSRTPVRLALERLESEGFIKLAARRSASVTEMTTAYLEDIFAGRLVVDSSLGRAGSYNLTPSDIDVLRKIDEEIQEIVLPEEHKILANPGHRFHEHLYQAAQAPIMYRYALRLVDHSRVFLNRYWYANRRIAQVTKVYYHEIFVACENRDPERVETLIREHRIDLAGVILQDRVLVDDLRVIPSLLNVEEMHRLRALVDNGEDPSGPSRLAYTAP
jgi:DNA-binding GntR family transcriptional regulator